MDDLRMRNAVFTELCCNGFCSSAVNLTVTGKIVISTFELLCIRMAHVPRNRFVSASIVKQRTHADNPFGDYSAHTLTNNY